MDYLDIDQSRPLCGLNRTCTIILCLLGFGWIGFLILFTISHKSFEIYGTVMLCLSILVAYIISFGGCHRREIGFNNTLFNLSPLGQVLYCFMFLTWSVLLGIVIYYWQTDTATSMLFLGWLIFSGIVTIVVCILLFTRCPSYSTFHLATLP